MPVTSGDPLLHWLHPVLLQTPAGPGQNCADPSMLVPVAGVIAVFYFVMLRPQQKEQQQKKEMLAALKKGDSVVTQAGMFGRVVSIGEKDLVLEVSVGGGSTRVRWLKSQIAGVDPGQKAAEVESSPDQKS